MAIVDSAGDAAPAARARREAAMPAGVQACAWLAGFPVVNRQDEELGHVEHVIVDLASGRAAYAIVSRGGVFGLGARYHAVPWSVLGFDVAGERAILDTSREHLERAPSFDREQWPDMDDALWAQRVHAHFGAMPEEGAVRIR